jgi:transcriptional regulator with XRE-family HTH domain
MASKQLRKQPTAVEEFIEQVNARLDQTGMSISELARTAQVGRPYLHRILSGEQVPSLTIAEAIANAIGLKITTLNVA